MGIIDVKCAKVPLRIPERYTAHDRCQCINTMAIISAGAQRRAQKQTYCPRLFVKRCMLLHYSGSLARLELID